MAAQPTTPSESSVHLSPDTTPPLNATTPPPSFSLGTPSGSHPLKFVEQLFVGLPVRGDAFQSGRFKVPATPTNPHQKVDFPFHFPTKPRVCAWAIQQQPAPGSTAPLMARIPSEAITVSNSSTILVTFFNLISIRLQCGSRKYFIMFCKLDCISHSNHSPYTQRCP